METPPAIRADKWLWAVRLYKTRGLASEACTAGQVRLNGLTIKPARPLRGGEVLTATNADLTRTVKVLAVVQKRVGPKLVPHYLEDLTPPEEFARQKERSIGQPGLRPRGAGRPTKRDRRILQSYFGEES